MYGLKEVYKLNKNLEIYKCKDLINNAKFAFLVDTKTEKAKVFTTLKRKDMQNQLSDFLHYLKDNKKCIHQGKYLIMLDNI